MLFNLNQPPNWSGSRAKAKQKLECLSCSTTRILWVCESYMLSLVVWQQRWQGAKSMRNKYTNRLTKRSLIEKKETDEVRMGKTKGMSLKLLGICPFIYTLPCHPQPKARAKISPNRRNILKRISPFSLRRKRWLLYHLNEFGSKYPVLHFLKMKVLLFKKIVKT